MSIREDAVNALLPITEEAADAFLNGLGEILSDASEAAQQKVFDLVREGFEFKRKALAANNAEEARDYAAAAGKSARRVETVLLAEKIVAEERTAALVSDMFLSALSTVGSVVQVLVMEIAKGLAKGAVDSLTGEGGDGSNPSSIFPFA